MRWMTWQAVSCRPYERAFNQRHSLSGATLNMLRGMRQQLVGALSGRGLIGNLPQASANAGAGSLVRAVLAVGMYPLMGRLLVPGAPGGGGQQAGGGNKPTLATLRGERVRIHPHSVNAKLHDNIRNNASNSDLSAAEKKAPVLVCFDEAGGSLRTSTQPTLILPLLLRASV